MTLRRSRTRQFLLANRRPRVSLGRRFALALVLALAATAGGASADSGSGPMVTATIYAAGSATSTSSVSAAQLLADPQNCPAYSQTNMTEYSASGSTSVGLPQESGSGAGTWPMSTILHCLQSPVSVDDVTGITVLNGDGSPQVAQGSQLTSEDLASPSDFLDSSEAPVVSNLGSSFQYNRPWRGQGDLDGNDQVTTADPIAIAVFEGPPLTVTATASTSSPAAGASVSFNATVAGNQGSALTYDWSFGDNLPDSAQANPAVTYTDGGSYTVTLQVTDANGGGGGTTVSLTVSGSPLTTPPATTSTPKTNSGALGTGTNSNGGTHGSTGGNGKGSGSKPSTGNGNTGNGSSRPASSHTQKPSHSRGTSPSRGSGTRTATSPSDTASSPATPAATTPSTQPSRSRQSPHRAPTHKRAPATNGASGQLVTGRLIADVTPLAASSSPLVRPAAGSAAAAPRPASQTTSPLGVIAGGLAIVLLLGLGAGTELRGRGWWRTLRLSN